MNRVTLLTTVALASALLLGACGSSSDEPAEPAATGQPSTTQTPTASSRPSTTPTVGAPSGTATAGTPSPAAPTTAAPAGKLIDYETDDEDGVTIVTASDTAKLKGSSADFKAFIAAELKRNAEPEEGCTEPAQIYVSRIDTGGWARGGYFVPQCGGYATLWAKPNGAWTEVWSGQSLVECSTLTRYEIPARIAGAQCLEGEDAVTYSG